MADYAVPRRAIFRAAAADWPALKATKATKAIKDYRGRKARRALPGQPGPKVQRDRKVLRVPMALMEQTVQMGHKAPQVRKDCQARKASLVRRE
jgi:hypothetical protein